MLSLSTCSMSPALKARLLMSARANVSRAALLGLTVAEWRALAKRDDNPLHRAADAHYKTMLLAVHAAFAFGRKAYKSGGADAAVKAIHSNVLRLLPPVLLKTVVAGGEVAIAGLKKMRGAELRTLKPPPFDKRRAMPVKKGAFNIRFDVKDPRAVKWAKEHAAELAKGISDSARERIQNAIANRLEGDDSYDDILDAVGSQARAELISRTETQWAAHEGQQQGWDQAIDKGLLTGDERVVWISTAGCCNDCDDMDGETRDLDGEYDGVYSEVPGHPNCRCTEGIAG